MAPTPRCVSAMALGLAWSAYAFEDPQVVLDRFLLEMKSEFQKLPDFVCSQELERFTRAASERPWEKTDSWKFEVALVGEQELYARPGSRGFQNRPLVEMVAKGTISTGQFANLARHVFLTSTAKFSFRGEAEQDGRAALEYEYEVPPEKSSYRLRSGTMDAIVGFQGSFWVDRNSGDLIRLDVQAFDMPDRLGIAETNTSVKYARHVIDSANILLPSAATLNVVATDGVENLNRTRLSGCRHYRTETAIRFDTNAAEGEADRVIPPERIVPKTDAASVAGALLEVALEGTLDPSAASVGDVVRAVVTRPIKDGERVLVPQGAKVTGHLVRLDKQAMPFPMYEIALEFSALEYDGKSLPFNGTMIDAGPAAGLIHQAKRMDPTFTRRRTNRIDILVREVQRGQGILNWDARRGPVPQGLKMRWRPAVTESAQ